MSIPSRFHGVEAARARYGRDLIDLIMSSVTVSDEPADRLVAAFGKLPPGTGWKILDQALEHGQESVRDAPQELAAVVTPPPAWVDHDLVDAGATAWWRAGGFPQMLALTAGSLAGGYWHGALARPLAATGRLIQMAPRRLSETSQWVLLATRPGALRPGAAGVSATVRLRLVHALVRAHLLKRGAWDVDNWGQPISVGDTVATGMVGFFVTPVNALADLGIRFTPAELEAINHQWRYISHLMGAPDGYLPRTYAETTTWAEAALAIDGGPIEESAELLRALLFHGVQFPQALPRPAAAAARWFTGHALGALARRWMGDERADELKAPNTPLKRFVPALRMISLARDLARAGRLLGTDERIVQRELALIDRMRRLSGQLSHTAIEPEHAEREPVLTPAA